MFLLLVINCFLISCNGVTNSFNQCESNSNNEENINIKDLEIDLLKSNSDFESFPINTYLNFTLILRFDKSSNINIVSFDNIELIYEKADIDISLTSNSHKKGNQFLYVVNGKNAKNIPVKCKINDYEKVFIFPFVDSCIETSIINIKRNCKLNDEDYGAVFLTNYVDSKLFLEKYNMSINSLRINEEYFENHSILAIAVGYSSSDEKIDYISSSILGEALCVNFVYTEKSSNTVWDYYEDIYFLKIENEFSNMSIRKINAIK